MQSQSDKAIKIDGLTGRLCHGLVVLVVVVVVVLVLLPDSTRYVGINNNIILIFIREKLAT